MINLQKSLEILIERGMYQYWTTVSQTLHLTLSMLRLLSSKAQEHNNFENHLNPVMLIGNLIALTEHSQMSTYMSGFQSFFRFLHTFVLAKLATSSIKVNLILPMLRLLSSKVQGHKVF